MESCEKTHSATLAQLSEGVVSYIFVNHGIELNESPASTAPESKIFEAAAILHNDHTWLKNKLLLHCCISVVKASNTSN